MKFVHFNCELKRMFVSDPRSFSTTQILAIKKGVNGESKRDDCDGGALLYQLSYQVNWELIRRYVGY